MRRVAPDGRDFIHIQPGVRHGLSHGNAVGVLLVQPSGVKLAGERARAQEHRFVALAFFFRKADDFDAKRQAPPGAVQRAYAGHGHQNAQAPVVFAAVAHGVKVAAGQQARR